MTKAEKIVELEYKISLYERYCERHKQEIKNFERICFWENVDKSKNDLSFFTALIWLKKKVIRKLINELKTEYNA